MTCLQLDPLFHSGSMPATASSGKLRQDQHASIPLPCRRESANYYSGNYEKLWITDQLNGFKIAPSLSRKDLMKDLKCKPWAYRVKQERNIVL